VGFSVAQHGECKGYRMKVSRPHGARDCARICTENCKVHRALYERDEIIRFCSFDILFFGRT